MCRKMRIGSECRSLVKNWLSHHGAASHRSVDRKRSSKYCRTSAFANLLHALCSESGVRQQERQFEQRETVRGEDEKGIPQEFIRGERRNDPMPSVREESGENSATRTKSSACSRGFNPTDISGSPGGKTTINLSLRWRCSARRSIARLIVRRTRE